MRCAKHLGVLLFGLTLTGCATILGGSKQTITVNSNVAGAQVWLNQQLLGVTPLSTDVKPGQSGTLRVTADGYQPYQVALNKQINPTFWGNCISGGSFGSSTDYATGAMYKYEPSTFFVTLQPADLPATGKAEWQRVDQLRGFVLLNNQAIVADLAAGEGEYLDVLKTLLNVNSDELPQAVDRWRLAYTESQTVLDFAERMIAELD